MPLLSELSMPLEHFVVISILVISEYLGARGIGRISSIGDNWLFPMMPLRRARQRALSQFY
jgi:hypothetical protein